jgi:hypothetical protein
MISIDIKGQLERGGFTGAVGSCHVSKYRSVVTRSTTSMIMEGRRDGQDPVDKRSGVL